MDQNSRVRSSRLGIFLVANRRDQNGPRAAVQAKSEGGIVQEQGQADTGLGDPFLYQGGG
jgi:hypothetical protein